MIPEYILFTLINLFLSLFLLLFLCLSEAKTCCLKGHAGVLMGRAELTKAKINIHRIEKFWLFPEQKLENSVNVKTK